jgi:mitochondrial fission protein ELM1
MAPPPPEPTRPAPGSDGEALKGVTAWIATEGKAGMVNQCLGLTEALGIEPHILRICLRSPWDQLVPKLRLGLDWAFSRKGDSLAPPWPDLLVACGRRAIAAALKVRRASAGRCFTIYLQDPTIDPGHFDLVIAPRHDQLEGPNVIRTLGSLHRVTPARLAEAGHEPAPEIENLPQPRIAVLIGGSSRSHRLGPEEMEAIAEGLGDAAAAAGAGLMITPSRRTGAAAEAVLRRALRETAAVIWDGSGDNPYFRYLARAEAIAVTCDSVNMICEAAATGKPVHLLELPGGSLKFELFYDELFEAGIARRFEGRFESWRYEPLLESARVANLVRKAFNNWRNSLS